MSTGRWVAVDLTGKYLPERAEAFDPAAVATEVRHYWVYADGVVVAGFGGDTGWLVRKAFLRRPR